MHPDLSPQLHSGPCNDLIKQLTQCRADHPFGRFVGSCNEYDRLVNKCLKKERLEKRAKNNEGAMKAKMERYEQYGK
ncbi:COX assembly mitochondrial protein 2 homolog [Watersipora subatra]|uniref:COX assembly mitochondrial protein 2 homolog n=1 Tax=Watersipora subatra TaxID=2589382 RepID=UPI00355B8954